MMGCFAVNTATSLQLFKNIRGLFLWWRNAGDERRNQQILRATLILTGEKAGFETWKHPEGRCTFASFTFESVSQLLQEKRSIEPITLCSLAQYLSLL